MFRQHSSGLDQLLNRPRRSAWDDFTKSPCMFLAKKLYSWQSRIPAQPLSNAVSVVCISDTHNSQPLLPAGDILIHAGDLTQSGSFKETQATLDWLRKQPFEHKIVIAGNDDTILASPESKELDWGDITYLENSSTEVTCSNGRTLRLYGSPFSCQHGNWAFQYPRGVDIWHEGGPVDTDILITHGPPQAHLDLNYGCAHLLRELWRVQPKVHVFGHVHEGYGQEWVKFDKLQDAYERTVAVKGGVLNLLSLVYHLIRFTFTPPVESRCLLVNAPIVGGLRDERRHEPTVVLI